MGCVPLSSSSGLILDACLETVRCRSTPYLASHQTWVDRCLPAFSTPCCPAVLLISALGALRPSFEENSVAECGLFYRVAIQNTQSFQSLVVSGFLFATLLVVVPSSLGLVRCVILYLLKSFVMERILSSELSFFILLMSRLFMRFPSSFYKDRVVAFFVRQPLVALRLMSSFCSNMITLPCRWMDKSEICPLNYTVVWICAVHHFSCVSKWTVALPNHVLTGLVGRFYHYKSI